MATLKNYHHFDGLAWATGYLTNALAYQGVTAPHTGKPYTEALLMGINGGICAGYFAFEYEGHDPHLHFLTRYIFDENPGAVFERLAIPMTPKQTPDADKGAANVINALAQGKPAITWVDLMSLDPLGAPIDVQGYWFINPVLVYGYEVNGSVQYADRARVPLAVPTDTFAAARAKVAKVRHRMMSIDAPNADKLPAAVEAGMRDCITIFVDKPPVGPKANFGFDAYKKWVRLLTDIKDKKSWGKMFAPGSRMYSGLESAYRALEVWYTGACGARGIYADFLDEAAVILGKPALREVAGQFRRAAELWSVLATALLPDHIAPFKETRELLCRDYDLFLAQGAQSRPERAQIADRLKHIKAQVSADFPLSDKQAAAMRAELADHIMRIHDTELDAIHALQAAMQ